MNEKASVLKLTERLGEAMEDILSLLDEAASTLVTLAISESYPKKRMEEIENLVKKIEDICASSETLSLREAIRTVSPAPTTDIEEPEMTPVIDRGIHDS